MFETDLDMISSPKQWAISFGSCFPSLLLIGTNLSWIGGKANSCWILDLDQEPQHTYIAMALSQVSSLRTHWPSFIFINNAWLREWERECVCPFPRSTIWSSPKRSHFSVIRLVHHGCSSKHHYINWIISGTPKRDPHTVCRPIEEGLTFPWKTRTLPKNVDYQEMWSLCQLWERIKQRSSQ